MDSALVVSTDSNLDSMSVILMGKCLARHLDSLSDSLLDEQRVDLMAHKKEMQLVLYLAHHLDSMMESRMVQQTVLKMVNKKE